MTLTSFRHHVHDIPVPLSAHPTSQARGPDVGDRTSRGPLPPLVGVEMFPESIKRHDYTVKTSLLKINELMLFSLKTYNENILSFRIYRRTKNNKSNRRMSTASPQKSVVPSTDGKGLPHSAPPSMAPRRSPLAKLRAQPVRRFADPMGQHDEVMADMDAFVTLERKSFRRKIGKVPSQHDEVMGDMEALLTLERKGSPCITEFLPEKPAKKIDKFSHAKRAIATAAKEGGTGTKTPCAETVVPLVRAACHFATTVSMCLGSRPAGLVKDRQAASKSLDALLAKIGHVCPPPSAAPTRAGMRRVWHRGGLRGGGAPVRRHGVPGGH